MWWEKLANYCYDTYGSHIDWESRFFICPECGEPIYECDWDEDQVQDFDGNYYCPVCDFNLTEGDE